MIFDVIQPEARSAELLRLLPWGAMLVTNAGDAPDSNGPRSSAVGPLVLIVAIRRHPGMSISVDMALCIVAWHQEI